jgi:hypothetical protein
MKHKNTPLMVSNFPEWYPWYKKLGSNITFLVSHIPIWPRRNTLSRSDIKTIKHIIESWDIILGGSYHEVSWIFIDGIVTHAIAYIDRWRCVHAFAHGVGSIGLKRICRTYDSIIILRPYWRSSEQKSEYLKTIISNIGKPYDFFFGLGNNTGESYFCTELINDSFRKTHYDTLLESIKPSIDELDKMLDETFRAHRALSPEEMIYGNFEVIFYSENIKINKDGKYVLKNGKYKDLIDL